MLWCVTDTNNTESHVKKWFHPQLWSVILMAHTHTHAHKLTPISLAILCQSLWLYFLASFTSCLSSSLLHAPLLSPGFMWLIQWRRQSLAERLWPNYIITNNNNASVFEGGFSWMAKVKIWHNGWVDIKHTVFQWCQDFMQWGGEGTDHPASGPSPPKKSGHTG